MEEGREADEEEARGRRGEGRGRRGEAAGRLVLLTIFSEHIHQRRAQSSKPLYDRAVRLTSCMLVRA